MKQRIRLTESQLHSIIRRCVNEAVNELDPRTYASYADKRAAQGQMDKAKEGRDAAIKAFNQQYAQNGDFMTDGYQLLQNNWSKDNYGKHVNNRKHYSPYIDKSVDDRVTYYRNGDKETTDEKISDGYTGCNYNGASVARQMATGTGKYIKGKGWQ